MLAVVAFAGLLLAQVVALVAIPLGLPGLWLQVGAAAVAAAAGGAAGIGWGWVAAFAALALVAELAEFLAGRWGARRFGGSPAAGWGALAGGLAGALIGVPVPVLGSAVGSFAGTFAGAVIAELWSRGGAGPDVRVGLGALLGRAAGVAVKLAAAFAIAIASVTLELAALVSP